MAKSVYLVAMDADSGKSVIALGLAEAMSRRAGAVAVFRPVVDGPSDRVVDLLHPRLRMTTDRRDCLGVGYEEIRSDPDAAVRRVVERYHRLADHYDTVLIVGTDYTDVASPTEFDVNLRIAVNLGSAVVPVVSGAGRSTAEIAAAVRLARDRTAAAHVGVAGVIVNRAEPTAVLRELDDTADTWVLPDEPLLSAPTVDQLARTCEAELLRGDREMLGRPAGDLLVAAMTLPHVLDHLTADAVVITAGDRGAIAVGLLVAHHSRDYPALAAIVLTGGLRPPPQVHSLLSGLDSRLPVLLTAMDTFETATAMAGLRGRVTPASRGKIATALGVFDAHVDADRLLENARTAVSDVVTPLMFEHRLMARARRRRCRVVLPEGTEPRVIQAADIVVRRGVADLVLIGEGDKVRATAAELGADISGIEVVSVSDAALRARFGTEYARLRAHKGVTADMALDRVADPSYFGTMMVHEGLADGMVSGAVHTTAQTVRPALEIIKTAEDVSVVSSVFFMCLPERVLVYGDCAIVPEPTAPQLADIAESSAVTAKTFGVAPAVAMLSYATGDSGGGADVDKVREATELLRRRRPDLPVEGPIQYDAAADSSVAAAKLPHSRVAGNATVFVVPDLNTGNNLYKAVQRSAGAVAVGPVLQGLAKPVNDLSRGATVADIVDTIALTAVQAGAAE